jgi:hypothetical protein
MADSIFDTEFFFLSVTEFLSSKARLTLAATKYERKYNINKLK